jgi:alpha-1,2-mannosyltransferase
MRNRWAVVGGVVFGVACLLRIGIVLGSRGGPSGNFGYDAGVYYTAADALTHGRLPYRDFILLHPPAMMLALTPFAVLGRLTSDHAGFMVANTAFAVLGAVNAVLVVAIARRAALPIGAAALGGLFYAVWYGAVAAEFSARLEPFSSFAFLCGVLALMARRMSRRRALILAGLGFGLAVSIKIWWIVPLIVVLAWYLRSSGTRRDVAPLAGGAVAAFVLIDAPFFLAAPGLMWRMVISDQLDRHGSNSSPLARLDQISSLHSAFPSLSTVLQATVLLVIAALAVVLGIAAWRVPAGRLFVIIAVAQLLVLLAAPTYFSYYSGYLAAAVALVVAAGAHGIRSNSRSGRLAPIVAVICVFLATAATATALLTRPIKVVAPFPGAPLAQATAHVRCVVADSPMALIELNVLSRDLAAGCPNWVDVSGRTYDVDAPPNAKPLSRPANAKWQADLRRYLLSGNAMIIIRPATGYSAATRRLFARLPVMVRVGQYSVYQVPPDHQVPGARAGY